jgi:hypothetical protein
MAGEVDLIARLDRAFGAQRQLAPGVLASIEAWQRTDRTYEVLQHAVRDLAVSDLAPSDIDEVADVRAHLDLAIRSAKTPFPMLVYRGVRSVRRTLGLGDARDAVDRTFEFAGYCATTIFREVAVDQFTARDGALLEIALPAGLPALWVAGVGSLALRHQGELLLSDKVGVHVYSHRMEGSIEVLSMEVIKG